MLRRKREAWNILRTQRLTLIPLSQPPSSVECGWQPEEASQGALNLLLESSFVPFYQDSKTSQASQGKVLPGTAGVNTGRCSPGPETTGNANLGSLWRSGFHTWLTPLSLVPVVPCGQTYHPKCIRPSGGAMKLSIAATLRRSTFSWGFHANWRERIGGRTLPRPISQGRMKWNGKITLTITWVITTVIIVTILCLLSFLCSETVGETGF